MLQRIRLIQPPLVQPLYRQLTLPVVGAEFQAAGLQVEVNDQNVEPVDWSDVDLVGVTCHVYNADRAFAIARRFRQLKIPVIIGGTFATVAPHLVAPHCDAVVVGELEGQTQGLLADANQGKLKAVYRAAQPPSLQSTLRPDFSLLNNSAYLRFNFPLEVSRGCRFDCRFCTAGQLYPHARVRALEDIGRDLAQYDHGLVEIVDVNFLNDPTFFKKVLPLLQSAPIPGWMGQTTLTDLARDHSLPGLFAASGCRALFVGLETLQREGLRQISKAWSKPGDFFDVVDRFQRAGILIQVGIIVGLDSDSQAGYARLAETLEKSGVQSVSITHLHYYPGTSAFAQMQQRGRLLSEDWSHYDGNHPVIRPERMSLAEQQELIFGFLRRLYGARSIFRRSLHRGMLQKPSQLLHHLSLNVAMRDYYREMEALWRHRQNGAAEEGHPASRQRLSFYEKQMADSSSRVLDYLWSRFG